MNTPTVPTLRLALVQADLHWENPQANRDNLERLLDAAQHRTPDVIVLPEMFTTGFSNNAPALAEPPGGTTTQWMQAQARQRQAAVVGSLIIAEGGHYYNRLLWVMPDGEVLHYDKRHLFTLAGEHHVYTAGRSRVVVAYKGWQIMPLVCYDLRFPVWSRNDLAYDVLLYVANFPERRAHAWRSLLVARAIENQAYTVGVNRVGDDGNGIYYAGDTCAIRYDGRSMAQLPAREWVQWVELSHTAQQAFRQQMAFLDDRDVFELRDA